MWQLLTIAALLALMLGLDGLAREVSRIDAALDPKSIATTGFIILAAFTCGELGRRLRLPALVGYLIAGIAFGPSLAELLGLREIFSRQVIDELRLVNILAVGVVGTMGGCEIQVAELRRSWRAILLIFGLIAATVLPATVLVVLGLSHFAGELVPFFAGVPLPQVIGGAALIGVMAMGMSPAATIALIQELGARGPFSSLALGIVVVADLLLVAMFLIVLALTRLTLSPEGLSAAGVASALPGIAAEFGWALVLGVGVGLLFILYLHFVRREILLFALGLIFAATYAAQALHAETLLVFLSAGFIVRNLSRHGHTLLHAFEEIAMPVFVVYFTTQAAGLDLRAMSAYLPAALALVAVRTLTLGASVRLGSRLARTSERTQGNLWLCFFSQGGVDLVLAGMVAATIPGWGADVQVLVTSTVMIYLFVGPPLFKLAVERAGESTSAREEGLENLSQETSSSSSPTSTSHELPEPAVTDERLAARLRELRGEARALDEALNRGRVDAAAEGLAAGLAAIERASAALVRACEGAAAPADAAAARDAFILAIAAEARRLAAIEPGLAAATDLQALIHGIEGAERFSTSFEVAREEHLFALSGAEPARVRVVRRARRLRRRLAGPGTRAVPVGRLWRYHVAMGVPIELWRQEAGDARELWRGIAAHLRALDELAAEVSAGALPAADPRLAERADASRARLRELELLLARLVDELRERTSRAIARAFAAFLEAVELAGTIELPAYRYRPSRRFDAATAARTELVARRERDTGLARGARDELVAWASARAFEVAASAEAAALRDELATRLLAPARAGIEELRRAANLESPTILEHLGVLRPALASATAALARSEALVGDGQHARALTARLAADLDDVPIELAPLAEGARVARVSRLELRRWLHLEVAVEAALLVDEASERIAAALRQELGELDRLAAVAQYYWRAANGGPAALADELRQGLGRLALQIDGLAEAQRRSVAEISGDLERAIVRRASEAVEPVLQRRYDLVQRRLAERALATPARAGVGALRRLRERIIVKLRRLRPLGAEALSELGGLLAKDAASADVALYERLLADAATIERRLPLLYRRLFGPTPDVAELLVDRPGPSAALAGALARWRAGSPTCALLRGDRGAGKRTIVRRALADHEDTPVIWLRLTSALDDERGIAAALGELAGLGPADTFESISRRLAEAEGPRLVVVENGERLFKRAPGGQEAAARFLRAIRETGPGVMWLVLISEAGATLLDALVGLEGRFDAVIEVPPMDADQIAAMLLARHRLSGRGLELAGIRRGPLERLWPARLASPRRGETALRHFHALSGGNPRQALTLWLAAAHAEGEGAGRIVIGPLPRATGPLGRALGLDARLLLAALAQHGPLRPELLAAICGRPRAAVDAELADLRGRGLVGRSASDPQALLITPHLIQPLTRELRDGGMV